MSSPEKSIIPIALSQNDFFNPNHRYSKVGTTFA